MRYNEHSGAPRRWPPGLWWLTRKIGARQFYLKYGYVPLHDQPNRLNLPMRTIERLFRAKHK